MGPYPLGYYAKTLIEVNITKQMPAGTVVSTTKQNIISAYYDVKREDNFVMAAAFRDGNL